MLLLKLARCQVVIRLTIFEQPSLYALHTRLGCLCSHAGRRAIHFQQLFSHYLPTANSLIIFKAYIAHFTEVLITVNLIYPKEDRVWP